MLSFREFFFPRIWRNKLLFSEKIVGISIDGNIIRVAHIAAKRSGSEVKKLESFTMNSGDPRTYNHRLTAALKKVAPTLDKKARIHVAFPAHKVIMKELTVPFMDEEKIKMVIEFEVESSIPFALENAVIDFIVIEKSEVRQSSRILVAAAQLDEVKKFVDIFKKADIDPSIVTVDALAISNVAALIPDHEKVKNEYVVAHIFPHAVRINLMSKNTLIATRMIPVQTRDEGDPDYAHVAQEIDFAIHSFSLGKEKPFIVDTLLLSGDTSLVAALEPHIKDSIDAACKSLEVENIAKNKRVKIRGKSSASTIRTYVAALGTGLTPFSHDTFTLRHKSAEKDPLPTMRGQLIMASVLISILFGLLGGIGYMEVNEAQAQVAQKEKDEQRKLRKILPKHNKGRKRKSVAGLAKAAQEYINEQEDIWAPFSRQRLRPLEILQELTTVINKKQYDVKIEQVFISGDEQDSSPIEVTGFFRSKTGSEHISSFAELEEALSNSKLLTLTEEIDPIPGQNGVQFVARFKYREE